MGLRKRRNILSVIEKLILNEIIPVERKYQILLDSFLSRVFLVTKYARV